MPKLSTTAVPSYRLHKQSGQAVVTLDGRDHLLGTHGSVASREKYNRLIAEWLANGRQLPAPKDQVTVVEVVRAFWRHARDYYRHADGTPTTEVRNVKVALKVLTSLYADAPADDFGPLALKAVRDAMIRKGWCRTNINRAVGRVKLCFKWAAENELVDPSVHHGLTAVSGLRAGRSEAPESEPVKSVPDPTVDAVLQHVSPPVAAMIRLQRLTGMRPGEVCSMRGVDIDATGRLWEYRPAQHKTQHHGHERVVVLGPQARAVVEPFLKPDLNAPLFSPADGEAARRAKLTEARRTPIGQGNRPGTNVLRRPERKPGDRYTVTAYCRAIARGCDHAFPLPDDLAPRRVQANGRKAQATRWETKAEWRARMGEAAWAKVRAWRKAHRWHPHRLRHSAATEFRKRYGLEVAQVLLGHKTLTVTQVYAEKNVEAARKIMGEVG